MTRPDAPSGSVAALAAFARGILARGERAVLAHLVEVTGSHYRRPGARMIFAESGETAGSVSGGCLEAELRRRVPAVLEEGARFVAYDLSREEDLVFGSGLGCGGRVGVLVLPIGAEAIAALEALESGDALETVYRSTSPSAPVGRTRLLDRVSAVAADRRIALPDGVIDVFIERLDPAPRLVLGGAGEDLVPLARIGIGLGWRVEAASPRATDAERRRWEALEIPLRPAGAIEGLVDGATAAVVATHRYLDDVEILRRLRTTRARYIGVLGSRRRVARMLEDTDDVPDAIGRARIHGPAGLDLGAETPEQIALAIASEIQAVLQGRPGGPLRDGAGAIHADPAARSLIPVDILQETCDRTGSCR